MIISFDKCIKIIECNRPATLLWVDALLDVELLQERHGRFGCGRLRKKKQKKKRKKHPMSTASLLLKKWFLFCKKKAPTSHWPQSARGNWSIQIVCGQCIRYDGHRLRDKWGMSLITSRWSTTLYITGLFNTSQLATFRPWRQLWSILCISIVPLTTQMGFTEERQTVYWKNLRKRDTIVWALSMQGTVKWIFRNIWIAFSCGGSRKEI